MGNLAKNDRRKMFLKIRPRSSAGLEQEPSKLWVAGSSPAGVAKFMVAEVSFEMTYSKTDRLVT